MNIKPEIELENALLIEEYKESWAHYRHMEIMRQQFLGYYFAIFVGVLSFLIAIYKESSWTDSKIVIIGIFTLGLVLYMISISLYINLRKIGIVLSHYEYVIRLFRIQFYKTNSELIEKLDIRKNKPSIINVFSIQTISEYIFLFNCIGLILFQFMGAIYFSVIQSLGYWVIIFWIYIVIMVVSLIYVYYKNRKK
jgi:heme/copper-type cytochrome/quinol oxidase subunit 4